MDYNLLGERLKMLRKQKGLSQKELADGICEPSQLSKFERGLVNPSSKLLGLLAKRLEVSLDYFFNEDATAYSSLETFKNMTTHLLEDRNYKELEYLWTLEKNNEILLSMDDCRYLEWIEALVLFYNQDKKKMAISKLEKLSTQFNQHNLTYLNILNTLANFYVLTGRLEEYENSYRLLFEEYQTRDFTISTYLFGYIRLQHNHAYYLWKKKENLAAIKIALETIECCKTHHTSYQLAPLLTIVANAGESFLTKDKLLDYYTDAKHLCKIYNNELLYIQIEEALEKSFS